MGREIQLTSMYCAHTVYKKSLQPFPSEYIHKHLSQKIFSEKCTHMSEELRKEKIKTEETFVVQRLFTQIAQDEFQGSKVRDKRDLVVCNQ